VSFRPILAIELSQAGGEIALGLADGSVRVAAVPPGDGATEPLFPAIDALVRGAGLGPRDLRALAVSAGPGGFTGLRISTVAAKMLAEALGVPVLAVPSAAAVASVAPGAAPAIVALAAKRDTAYLAAFLGRGPATAPFAPAETGDAERFARLVDALPAPPILLADRHLPEPIAARAAERGVAIHPPVHSAVATLELALAGLARGERTDPLDLGPIYPREPEAVTLWRERHPGR